MVQFKSAMVQSYNAKLLAALIGLLSLFSGQLFAQKKVELGNFSDLKEQLVGSKQARSTDGKSSMTLAAPGDQTFDVRFRKSAQDDESWRLKGHVQGHEHSILRLNVDQSAVDGNIILQASREAYKVFTNNGKVFIRTQDIDSVMCTGYPDAPEGEKTNRKGESEPRGIHPPGTDVYSLNSYPQAEATVLLDFDGVFLESTSWNNGDSLLAEPSSFTEEQIYQMWRSISEDFRGFNINITTDSTVFQNAPENRRVRCVFTPTNHFTSFSSGVAFIGSFTGDEPCWVFWEDQKFAFETGSHEIGHTLGLNHDGTSDQEYYGGHDDWAPIMGDNRFNSITHWSQGEYQDADNTEDDIAIITGSGNGFGFRPDDHGNSASQATQLQVEANDSVLADNNNGIISMESDVDYFEFTATGNTTVDLDFQPAELAPNLDVRARLFDSNNNLIASGDDPDGLPAAINTSLPNAGTYYIAIDGVGEDDPATTGYSDYSSLGRFSISGVITGEDFTVDCNGDTNGTAFIDSCGVCAGGNTGIVPNATCHEACVGAGQFDINEVYPDSGTYVKYEGKLYQNRYYANVHYPDDPNGPWTLVDFCKADRLDCSNASPWDPNTAYQQPGNEVVYNGDLFVNQWWTQNQTPDKTDIYGPWEFQGPCSDTLMPFTPTQAAGASSQEVEIMASPNPTRGPVTVNLDNASESGKVVITRPQGTRVDEVSVASPEDPVQINLSGLKPGLYGIRFESESSVSETILINKQ